MSRGICRVNTGRNFFKVGALDSDRATTTLEVSGSMKKRNAQPATKADVEEVAAMAEGEFRRIRNEMATKELVRELHENTQEEFGALRQEMHEGFRAVLAAIETNIPNFACGLIPWKQTSPRSRTRFGLRNPLDKSRVDRLWLFLHD